MKLKELKSIQEKALINEATIADVIMIVSEHFVSSSEHNKKTNALLEKILDNQNKLLSKIETLETYVLSPIYQGIFEEEEEEIPSSSSEENEEEEED